ncbi:MAG: flagellar hook-length control protein FliK, partial [Campylobacterota bacterium]|nr:flagellar hook-length control protein FliK [Campylobacterota bacterium]
KPNNIIEAISNVNIEVSDELADFINSQLKESKQSLKDPLLASSFLSSQNKLKEMVSQQQVVNAKKNIDDNKTLNSVKESANMLDLNADDPTVEEKKSERSQQIIENLNKKEAKVQSSSIVDKMVLNNKLDSSNSNNSNNAAEKSTPMDNEIRKVETTRVEEPQNSKVKETVVVVNVPADVTQSIQSKIIGAQQKVGNFMSEVARNMYLNYKPPVTAFRMNLNPENLGNISIVMRSNKADNSLTVSMNMSSSSTMEAFVDNKSSLQTALQRNLNDSSNVLLNFDMQGESSDSNRGQTNQENSSSRGREDTIDNNISNEEEIEELLDNNENYM